MSKTSARPEFPKPEEVNAVLDEARMRLNHAAHSFHALLTLLHNSSGAPAPQDFYYLLQPISSEVNAALDELNSIFVSPTTN